MQKVSWSEIKSLVDAGTLHLKHLENDRLYNVMGFDDTFYISCIILKDGGADQLDFENNYKSNSNKKLKPVDTDTGMPSISTRKLPADWYPEFREIELETCKMNSIHDKDKNDIDLGQHSIKFYDVNDVELTTQSSIDTDCVRTMVNFDPGEVWAIRGAYTRQIVVPTTPIYVWMDFKLDMTHLVPGLFVRNPYANGGLNMEFQNAYESVGDEGENYSFFNQGDGIEWTIRHDAGLKHRIRIIYQLGFSV